jgi:hypothetical protein
MTNKVLDELKDAYSFLRDPMLKLAIDRIEELETALKRLAETDLTGIAIAALEKNDV